MSDERVALLINNLRDAIKCLYRDRRDPIIRDVEVRVEMALTAIGMNRQQLLSRLAEAEKQNDAMVRECNGYKNECDELYRKIRNLNESIGGNFWMWQGDGEDHLESLTCPVSIRPEALAEIIRQRDEAKKHRDEAFLDRQRLNNLFDSCKASLKESEIAAQQAEERFDADLAKVQGERDAMAKVVAIFQPAIDYLGGVDGNVSSSDFNSRYGEISWEDVRVMIEEHLAALAASQGKGTK